VLVCETRAKAKRNKKKMENKTEEFEKKNEN